MGASHSAAMLPSAALLSGASISGSADNSLAWSQRHTRSIRHYFFMFVDQLLPEFTLLKTPFWLLADSPNNKFSDKHNGPTVCCCVFSWSLSRKQMSE